MPWFLASLATALPILPPATAHGQSVPALPMTETAMLGHFNRGPLNFPIRVDAARFEDEFIAPDTAPTPSELQARSYFVHGGTALWVTRVASTGSPQDNLLGDAAQFTGLHALAPVSDLRLFILPDLSLMPAASFPTALAGVRAFLEPRRAFLILDPPPGIPTASAMIAWAQSALPADASFGAVYFPYLRLTLDGVLRTLGPSGAMAAIYGRNDAVSGIWRSPAGTGLPLLATGLEPSLSTSDIDALNVAHVNAIRNFTGVGIVPWGSRTLDRVRIENRFLAPVRTRDWIAHSIQRGLAFAAVEDNNAALWIRIRAMTENFLFGLYAQGALAGNKPEEAFFVRCDASTTSAADIAAHRVNMLVGLAMIRPVEFDLLSLTAATHDPHREAPSPGVLVQVHGGQIRLAYPTEPGFLYHPLYSPQLPATQWVGVGPETGGDGAWRVFEAPATGGEGYYRVTSRIAGE